MKTNLKTGLILGMIFLSTNTFAQTNETVSEKKQVTETHLGFILNMVGTNFNYGKANSALAEDKKPVLGGQLGATFQAGLTPKTSLLTEIYFMMKGGALEPKNPSGSGKTTLRLYALELPVMARFHLGKYYVNAGPSVSYNFYGTRKTEGCATESLFHPASESAKRWDASIHVGGGYRFKIKQKKVALDIRYVYGLTNISLSNRELYNRYLNVSLKIYKPWKTNPLARNKN